MHSSALLARVGLAATALEAGLSYASRSRATT